jgi:hypothetical protein
MVRDQTIRYCVGMFGMVILGTAAMVLGGTTAQTIAVAVAGGVGFLGGHYANQNTEASVPLGGGQPAVQQVK